MHLNFSAVLAKIRDTNQDKQNHLYGSCLYAIRMNSLSYFHGLNWNDKTNFGYFFLFALTINTNIALHVALLTGFSAILILIFVFVRF